MFICLTCRLMNIFHNIFLQNVAVLSLIPSNIKLEEVDSADCGQGLCLIWPRMWFLMTQLDVSSVGSNSSLSASVSLRCSSVCGGSSMGALRCLKAYTEHETWQFRKKNVNGEWETTGLSFNATRKSHTVSLIVTACCYAALAMQN